MPDAKPKSENRYQASAAYTRDNWSEVSDNPLMTEADLARLRPVQEVPEVFARLAKRTRAGRSTANGDAETD